MLTDDTHQAKVILKKPIIENKQELIKPTSPFAIFSNTISVEMSKPAKYSIR